MHIHGVTGCIAARKHPAVAQRYRLVVTATNRLKDNIGQVVHFILIKQPLPIELLWKIYAVPAASHNRMIGISRQSAHLGCRRWTI